MNNTKSFFLSALILLFSVAAFAKKNKISTQPLSSKARMQQTIKELVSANNPAFVFKNTRTGSRLIAESTSYHDGISYTMSDSTYYAYYGAYGYDPTPAEFNFDFMNTFFYYNSNNLYDSYTHFSLSGLPPVVLTDSLHNNFGTGHRLEQAFTDYFAFGFTQLNKITYNGANLRQEEHDSMNFSGSVSQYKQQYVYNASNKVIELKYIDWDLGTNTWTAMEIDSVFYDGSGNINLVKVYMYDTLLATWTNTDLYNYTYTGANKIQSEWSQTLVGATWVNDTKADYAYDAGNKLVSLTASTWNAAVWVYDTKDSFYYAAGSYPSIYYNLYWDNINNIWVNASKLNYGYNASNQVQTRVTNTWDSLGAMWVLTDSSQFYYQNFTPQSVSENSSLNAVLTTYPNPVENSLQVAVALTDNQKSTLSLFDITGKEIFRSDLKNSPQYQTSIDMNGFPNGIYLLQLKGEQGVLNRKIVK